MERFISGKITLEDKKLGGRKNKVASQIHADKPVRGFWSKEHFNYTGVTLASQIIGLQFCPQAPASKAQLMDTFTIADNHLTRTMEIKTTLLKDEAIAALNQDNALG